MRITIGLLAIGFFVAGLMTLGHEREAISAISLRVGMLLSVWWLAYPQLRKVPPWLAATAGLLLLVVLRWPKFLLLAIPLLAVLWLLRPRAPRRARP